MLRLISFLVVLVFTSLFSEFIHASESDVYDFAWLDPDKEVYVLQNRKFRKKNSLGINVGAGITTSGAFVDGQAYQGRLNYFFTEDWGFELLYSKNEGKENSTALSVRNPGGAGSRPFRRIIEDYKGAMVLWSPFYAKINTFNKILYFDWILGLGAAEINETNNRQEFESSVNGNFPANKEKHTGLIWETALQFYINQSWNLRLDFIGTHYQARTALSTAAVSSKSTYSNYDLTLSLGFRF